ncbi:MAG: nebramycin 5' synthase [Nitrosomonadaceae bacterium]|nr:nebramycin 5' synthase [Nitrosomonadaceae bacterium]
MKRNCILSFTLSGHGFSGVVCLDGKIIVATSLERLTRVKNDILLPISRMDLETFGWKSNPEVYREDLNIPFDLERDYSAVDFSKIEKFTLLLNYLLEAGGVTLNDVDCVAYSYRHNASAKKFFKERNPNIEFVVPEHHYSHACQAFLPSPFEEAAIMVVDGQGIPLARTGGDQLSGCLAYGKGNSINVLRDLPVKCSLGGMYAAFTKKIGFETNEEGKTMGLAPYGNRQYYDVLRKDLKFETAEYDLRSFSRLIKRGFRPEAVLYQLPSYAAFLSKFKRRAKYGEITDAHKDLAFAVQKLTEDVMIFLANWLHKKTGSKNLCIAGGVGLNCVANYQVLCKSSFSNVFIHPNSGDNGLAVGQALHVYNQVWGNSRRYVAITDSLGKLYSEEHIRLAVKAHQDDEGISVREFSNLHELYDVMAAAIEAGWITSWYQGRSEFGPRALGNRSIIVDPRRRDMKDILNSRVKFRESFRPFTPSVLAERASEFFELDVDSPFMLLAAYVKPGKAELVPAITHVDNTARVQTVTRDINERYYDLINAFARRTGIPMVLETSFNVAGEPIVETPDDAIRCFFSTDIDVLCIDRFLLSKKKNPSFLPRTLVE